MPSHHHVAVKRAGTANNNTRAKVIVGLIHEQQHACQGNSRLNTRTTLFFNGEHNSLPQPSNSKVSPAKQSTKVVRNAHTSN